MIDMFFEGSEAFGDHALHEIAPECSREEERDDRGEQRSDVVEHGSEGESVDEHRDDGEDGCGDKEHHADRVRKKEDANSERAGLLHDLFERSIRKIFCDRRPNDNIRSDEQDRKEECEANAVTKVHRIRRCFVL